MKTMGVIVMTESSISTYPVLKAHTVALYRILQFYANWLNYEYTEDLKYGDTQGHFIISWWKKVKGNIFFISGQIP